MPHLPTPTITSRRLRIHTPFSRPKAVARVKALTCMASLLLILPPVVTYKDIDRALVVRLKAAHIGKVVQMEGSCLPLTLPLGVLA